MATPKVNKIQTRLPATLKWVHWDCLVQRLKILKLRYTHALSLHAFFLIPFDTKQSVQEHPPVGPNMSFDAANKRQYPLVKHDGETRSMLSANVSSPQKRLLYQPE